MTGARWSMALMAVYRAAAEVVRSEAERAAQQQADQQAGVRNLVGKGSSGKGGHHHGLCASCAGRYSGICRR